MSQFYVNQAAAGTTVTSITATGPLTANGVSGVPETGNVTIATTAVDLHTARYIVSPGGSADGANYKTINAAYAAAVTAGAPQTVFVQPGTYSENLTLVAGIDISAYSCDSSLQKEDITHNVTISGTVTASYSGSCSISGIAFQTNGSNAIVVSGSNTTELTLDNCFLNVLSGTGISMNSSGSSNLNFDYCWGNLAAGTNYFSVVQGNIVTFGGQFANQGSSTVSSTLSGGSFQSTGTAFLNTLSLSGTATASLQYTFIGIGNTTAITLTGGSTTDATFCIFASGTASAFSIGAGCVANLKMCTVSSANTNAITGVGTLIYMGLAFPGSSSTINVSTQQPSPWTVFQGGTGLTGTTINQILYSPSNNTIAGLPTANNSTLQTNGSGVPAWVATTPAVTWNDSTGATVTLVAANGYVTDRGGGVTYTLPASGTLGDYIQIVGKLGAWSVAQNANQQILFGSSSSTVGVTGSIASTNVGDCVEMVCITAGASTVWRVKNAVGNITVA